MPHMAMQVVTETNSKAADAEFLQSKKNDILAATTLADLGSVLELSAENNESLAQLDTALAPAVVQGILGAFRGAVNSNPVEAVQVVWLEHGGQRVEVGGSVPNGQEAGLVSGVVPTPPFDRL
jgi:hypothetical protein